MSNSYTADGPADAYRIQNSFSASSKGISSVLMNPAGIARSPTFEVFIGLGANLNSDSLVTFTVSDKDLGKLDTAEGGFFDAGIYFTDDISTNEFKTRDVRAALDYRTGAGITDIGAAFNFGDVFAFGIARKRPAFVNIDMNSYVPTVFKNTMNMYGKTFGDLSINEFGSAEFTGSGTSFATANPLYEKFTYNSTDAAVSSNVVFENKVTDDREIVLTVGGKVGSVMWGVNAIPITSSISLQNRVFTKTTSDSANMVYYVPNFDPGNSIEAYNWYASGFYTFEAGYAPYTFEVSPDEMIYSVEARGNYSASAMQIDLGFIWQATDDLSFALAYENIGGANLVYKGKDVFSTAESYVNTTGQPSLETGSGGSWDPINITPEVIKDSQGLYLPEEFTIELPRKGRIGFALKKPFFIAVDYERYFTDIIYSNATIRDVSFLRFGFESQLFALPLILRGESKWLLKPTVLGLSDPKQVEDAEEFIDKYPALPTSATIGFGFSAFGGEIGADFSENWASFLSLYEAKLMDFMKVVSYDLYFKTDSWDFTYTAVGEPFYLLTNNAELANASKAGEEFSESDFKINFVHSIKMGFRF
jgi:hypothetical protein